MTGSLRYVNLPNGGKMKKARFDFHQNVLSRFPDGGDKRDRTADLLTASQALSQLSYTPVSFPKGNLGKPLFLCRKQSRGVTQVGVGIHTNHAPS